MPVTKIDQSATIDQQLASLTQHFTDHFGHSPTHATVAPGRVNLIGEHTDYNDGFVLPMAINRACVAVGKQNDSQTAQVISTSQAQPAEFAVDDTLSPGEPKWSNYVRGAVAGCLKQGLNPGGFEMAVDSTVPAGGGLSSSAALEVATTTLIEAFTEQQIDPVEKALLCQAAEHHFAGMPCGIMDQFISTMGRAGSAMLIDCRSRSVKLVQLSDPSIEVLIINSNVKHELTTSEYATRRKQCEQACEALGVSSLRDATMELLSEKQSQMDDVIVRRAKHVITENERTQQAARAIMAGRWDDLGKMMFASHDSLRDDYEVSCKELDVLVDLARQHVSTGEIIGSRMTGGGFGGCTVTLIHRDAVEDVAPLIATAYEKQTGIHPTLYLTRPAAGARPLEVV